MRYAIKTHGMIFVGNTARAVVEAVEARHGKFRLFGKEVRGGWDCDVERVDEDVLEVMRQDYKVEEVD